MLLVDFSNLKIQPHFDPIVSNAYKEIIITPETELPVNIVNENFSLTAYVLKPYVKIDADWRRGYYTTANNYSLGTGAQSWDRYCYPSWW